MKTSEKQAKCRPIGLIAEHQHGLTSCIRRLMYQELRVLAADTWICILLITFRFGFCQPTTFKNSYDKKPTSMHIYTLWNADRFPEHSQQACS
jgi:hypothetical protein